MGGFRVRKYISDQENEFDILRKEHQELVNLISPL
jgi:hypothetical protein